LGRGSTETCFFRPFRALLALSWLPWARRPLSESVAENPNPDMWLLAGSQPHALHSLKRFFWRRPIVINHFGGKGASPALPSTPPFTQAPRSHPRPKALGFRIGASTVSSAVAGPNPRSPTTKPEFPRPESQAQISGRGKGQPQMIYSANGNLMESRNATTKAPNL
jgi:hypothetical protein